MTSKRAKPSVTHWAVTVVVSGLAGPAPAALPPAAAEASAQPAGRAALDARVQAVRTALAERHRPQAADAASADPAAQAPPWANWSNWSNWPKWSKWSNWANA